MFFGNEIIDDMCTLLTINASLKKFELNHLTARVCVRSDLASGSSTDTNWAINPQIMQERYDTLHRSCQYGEAGGLNHTGKEHIKLWITRLASPTQLCVAGLHTHTAQGELELPDEAILPLPDCLMSSHGLRS